MLSGCLLRSLRRLSLSLPVGQTRVCLSAAESLSPSLRCRNLFAVSQILFHHADNAKLATALSERARFLSEMFEGPEEEIKLYLSEHPHLLTMGIAKFKRISQLFQDQGITLREVMTYPEVYKRKYETLRSRIRKLQNGGIEKVTLTMINTTWTEYHKKSRRLILDQEAKEEYGSLVELLTRCLHISTDIASDIASTHQWLQQSKLSTTKEKLTVLECYGIPAEEVVERPWVLALGVEEMEEQLAALREGGLPYGSLREGVSYLSLIKLSPQNFPLTLERRQQEKEILGGCRSTTEYLCQRLGCTAQDVRERMLRSNHHLLAVSPRKLRDVLDFLLVELGLPPQQVVENARVFSFGIARLRSRLEQLRRLDLQVSVKLLAMDSRLYRKLVEKLEQSTV